MNPKKTTQDLLNKLDLFDPDTGQKVRGDLQNCRTAVSPEMLAVLVDETIWGLSLETSFGLAVARGMLLLIRRDPSCLHRYQAAIHLAGAKGPTLGRLMATHLVPVLLSGHSRIRHLFFETFEMMENAGVYTLPKPLEALDRMLSSDDCRSAETYLNLLHTAFSREMPYHRRQQLTVLLPKAALQYAPAKRPWQLQQLERVMRIDDRLASALISGMNKGLELLSPAALIRFVSHGLDQARTERQRGERFFALESRAGCSAFAGLQVAVSLPEVQPHLNRYLTARTGREVNVRPLSVLNAGTNDASPAAAGTCSDGNSVYLPDEVDRFGTPADNRKVYKCLARFEAGLIEFGTYRFDLEKTLEQCSGIPGCPLSLDIDGVVTDREETISDLESFFGLFPHPQLAEDLFLVYEHGRIRRLLLQSYPGLGFTCLPMFQNESQLELAKGENRGSLLPVYAHIACGVPTADIPISLPWEIDLMLETTTLFESEMQREAGAAIAETSGLLVAKSYTAVENYLGHSNQPVINSSYQPLQPPFLRRIRPDLQHLHGLRIEQLVRSLKKKLADNGVHVYASVLREVLVSRSGELHKNDIEEIIRRPENLTRQGRSMRQSREWEGLEMTAGSVSVLMDAELMSKGTNLTDCSSFWYREWDYRLGDYLAEHARVMECVVERGSSQYYRSTLDRYAGLVQHIRSAFELLKPQGLKCYRRWIEGEDFDYRQLLDFALDRRAGRTPSERLYIKRIKAQRDVAALLLVDLSRSTANLVSGFDTSVLDVEKEAIVLLSEALQVVGDQYAIDGFSGAGRLGVEYLRIKDFSDPLDDTVRCRIDAMAPRRNTRMGAAIRHAASRLSAVPSRVKLLIILGDGFPNDLNYNKAYAVEDTRRAIAELRTQGIYVHAITVNLDPANTPHLDELFGDIHHNLITDVTDLPDRLWQIYGALTR